MTAQRDEMRTVAGVGKPTAETENVARAHVGRRFAGDADARVVVLDMLGLTPPKEHPVRMTRPAGGWQPRSDGAKTCTKCGETKPRTAFYPMRSMRDGRRTDCIECNRARRRGRVPDDRHAYRMRAYGRWEPFVDAAPAREHVADLLRHGVSSTRVARLAGVAQPTVERLLNGFPNRGVPPSVKLRAEVAEALLAVRLRLEDLPAKACIDAAGTRRRVQALAVLGWSLSRLADRAGISRRNFMHLVWADTVRAGTARTVRRLYEQLWNQAPPMVTREDRISVTRTKAWAAEQGFVPAAAWDDDEIDNPAAEPHLPGEGSRAAALAEDAAELIAQGHTFDQAAERLGVASSTLKQARHRAAKAVAA